MIWRALTVWFGMAVLAVLNGTARAAWVEPKVGKQAGHVISTVTLCMLIFGAALLSISWLGVSSMAQAWFVGVFWLVLTLAFEFLAGHYLFGHPWERLLADYNILRGRVWVLVLVATLVAPPLCFALRSG